MQVWPTSQLRFVQLGEKEEKKKKGDHRSNKTGDRPRQPVNLLGSAEVVCGVCAWCWCRSRRSEAGVGGVGSGQAAGSLSVQGQTLVALAVPRCGAASPREPRLYLSTSSRVPGFVASASAGAPNWRTDGAWRMRAAGQSLTAVTHSAVALVGQWDADGGCVGPSNPVEPRLIAAISLAQWPAPAAAAVLLPGGSASQPRQFRLPPPPPLLSLCMPFLRPQGPPARSLVAEHGSRATN